VQEFLEFEAGAVIGRSSSEKADEHRAYKLSQLYRAMVLLHAQDHAGVLEICDSVLPLVARDPGKIYPLRLCLVLAGTADVALGNHERALERLSAARDEMNRQAVALDRTGASTVTTPVSTRHSKDARRSTGRWHTGQLPR